MGVGRSAVGGVVVATLLLFALLVPGVSAFVDSFFSSDDSAVGIPEAVVHGEAESVPSLRGDALHPEALRRLRSGSPGPEAAPGPGYYDTSRFLMGNATYAILLPESDGSIDTETENWTSTEITNVQNEIKDGLDWWAAQEADANVSFVLESSSPRVVNTSYEPINHPQSNESLWVNEVMAALGYTTGSRFDRVYAFINNLRTTYATDWAYAFFVVDSSNDADNKFADGTYFGYAYLGGPFVVMTYGNDGWGISNMDKVAAHETGHIFWATDEYDQGPTSGLDAGYDDESNGYLNLQEIWLSGCIMDTNNWCISGASNGTNGTRGQIGWRDTGGNPGVMDILDVPPETTLNAYPDPTNDVSPTYTGSATVVAYPDQSALNRDVTINTIAGVEYRVDGGNWTNATPTDGAFDGPTEGYNFTLLPQAEGNHTVESRARILVPTSPATTIYDGSPASDILTVDLTEPASAVDPLPTYTTGAVFHVSVTAVDAGSPLDHVELFYRKNGSAWTSYENDTVAPYVFTFDVPFLTGDGFFEFYSRAYDEAGNNETAPAGPDTGTIVDTRAPESAVEALPTYTTVTSFPINATASDSNGVASVELFYRVDGGSWTSYGNDTAAPYAWTFDAAGGDGLYEFQTVAVDAAGNDESPVGADASTVVDTGPPSSSVDALPVYETEETFAVTVTAVDAGSGVDRVELFFRRDGGTWTSYGVDSAPPFSWAFDTGSTGGDGLYEFYTVATDALDQTDPAPPAAEASTTVDTAAPTTDLAVAGTAGPGVWYRGAVTVTLTATDGGSGVAAVRYRVGGGPWLEYDEPFPLAGESLHTVEYYAEDEAGNVETTRSAQVGVDLGAPTVEVAGPATGATLFQDAVLLEWSHQDAGAGVVACAVIVDGGAAVDVGTATSHTLRGLPDGSHTVTVSCTDGAGRTAEDSVGFTTVTPNLLRPAVGTSWLQLALIVVAGLVVVLLLLRRFRRRPRA